MDRYGFFLNEKTIKSSHKGKTLGYSIVRGEMYIKDYLITKGFKEEWFDDTGNIVTINSSRWIDSWIILTKSTSNKSFFFEPFNKEDKKKSRRLWFHNIFFPKLTKIRFDKELHYNSQFMNMFQTGRLPNFQNVEEYKFNNWYILDYDPLICHNDQWILRDQKEPKNFFVIWMVFLTYTTQVQIKNE